jgi:hypothetical protein
MGPNAATSRSLEASERGNASFFDAISTPRRNRLKALR